VSRPRRTIRDNAVPLELISPAILIILMVVLLPLLFSFYTSFTDYRLIRPESLWQWIGTRNYERVLGGWDFWVAFGRTVLFVTVVLNLELLFGLGLALLVNRITWDQRTMRTIMMFPKCFRPCSSASSSSTCSTTPSDL
jgi:multiple sugar transport system permease protein